MFPGQPKAERLALTATYALFAAGIAAMGALAGLQHLLTRKPKRHLAEMSNAEIDATVPEPRDAHVRKGGDKIPVMLERGIHVIPNAMAERIDAYHQAYREWGQLDA